MMRAEQQKIKAIKDYKLVCYLMMFVLAFFVGLMLYGEVTGGNFLRSHPLEPLVVGVDILWLYFFLRRYTKLLTYPEDEDRA